MLLCGGALLSSVAISVLSHHFLCGGCDLRGCPTSPGQTQPGGWGETSGDSILEWKFHPKYWEVELKDVY